MMTPLLNVTPALFMQTALCLLILTAIIGVVQFILRFSGKPYPPAWMAMLHGLLAGAAATLLLFATFTVGLPPLANAALVLFIDAALGGVFLNLAYQWKALPLPKWRVIVHALIAVIGFLLLLASVVSMRNH
jgi:uncharacterized membrane protein HdeD (DUF308 family)